MTSTFIAEIFAVLTLLFSFTGAVIVATVLYIKKYIDKHDLFIATICDDVRKYGNCVFHIDGINKTWSAV